MIKFLCGLEDSGFIDSFLNDSKDTVQVAILRESRGWHASLTFPHLGGSFFFGCPARLIEKTVSFADLSRMQGVWFAAHRRPRRDAFLFDIDRLKHRRSFARVSLSAPFGRVGLFDLDDVVEPEAGLSSLLRLDDLIYGRSTRPLRNLRTK